MAVAVLDCWRCGRMNTVVAEYGAMILCESCEQGLMVHDGNSWPFPSGVHDCGHPIDAHELGVRGLIRKCPSS